MCTDDQSDRKKVVAFHLSLDLTDIGGEVCHLEGDALKDAVTRVFDSPDRIALYRNLRRKTDLPIYIDYITQFCKPHKKGLVAHLALPRSEADAFCTSVYFGKSEYPRTPHYDDNIKCGKWLKVREAAAELVSLDNEVCGADANKMEAIVAGFLKFHSGGYYAQLVEGGRLADHVAAVCESYLLPLSLWHSMSHDEQYSYCAERYAKGQFYMSMDKTDRIRCRKWYMMTNSVDMLDRVCHLEGDEFNSKVKEIAEEQGVTKFLAKLDMPTDLSDGIRHVLSMCKTHRRL